MRRLVYSAKFPLYLALLLIVACSTSNKFSYDDSYEFDSIPRGWIKEHAKDDEADYFYSKNKVDVFYSSSLCNYYEKKKIAHITMQRMQSLQLQQILAEKSYKIDDNEVKSFHISAVMYEKKVELLFTNFFRNNCYYEMVLIAPNKMNKELISDYESFLKNIDY